MSAEITNYQCPACTAPLRFDGESGKLVCDFCGSSYSVEEMEVHYAGKEKAAAEASAQKEPSVPVGESPDSELRAYQCPTCGAELICDQTTAAASCPYCGNPSVIPGQLSGPLKPDLILPFKIDKDSAIEALHKHYGKYNFYLPKLFRKENNIQRIQGVYVPFWLYDAHVSGAAHYSASDSVTTREGKYQVTRTMHYDVLREGNAGFHRIPVDGSRKMDNRYMDSLEPYDYSQLKPFSTAYLPGFLADRYDESAEECAPRMEARVQKTLQSLLFNDVHHAMVSERSFQSAVEEKQVQYALLPVWLLTTQWKDQKYVFAMNGQTGKFVGELPTDNGLFWRNVGILTVILTLILRFSGLTRWLLELF